jgi:hypothetical protein
MGYLGGPQSRVAANSYVHRNHPLCFHLNRLESGKDDNSPETDLQSSKTCRGSYLDSELYIFVKNFDFIS